MVPAGLMMRLLGKGKKLSLVGYSAKVLVTPRAPKSFIFRERDARG